jgi:mitogen-activated protein kinase kinase kinase
MTAIATAAPLTEAELLAVCYAPPTDPARENGLYLKQMRILPNRKDIGSIFGDNPPASALSPTSPTYSLAMSARTRDSPRTATSLRGANQTHRASTISVMSALGVPVSDNAPKPVAAPQAPLPKSPSSGSFLASRGRRMYNFFGHRPPSELISSHLAEYFPAAKRKDLEKGARNSMLRLGSKGDLDNLRSSIDSTRHSLDANRLPSRFSVASSNSSHRMSRASSYKNASNPPAAAIPEERLEVSEVPRLSVSGDDGLESRPAFDDSGTSTPAGGAPLLPPFEPSEESLSDSMPSFGSRPRPASIMQDRRNSVRSTAGRRLSTVSSRRKSRRVSDAASLLTVDEITAEVENRRASVITFAESEEEAEDDHFLAPENIRLSKAYSPGLVPEEEGEDSEEEASESSEEETSDEEGSEEEEEEEEEEKEDQHGKAVTSTGSE